MKQAVILAGGKGTRLAERLGGRPKPLVEIGGQPLLGRQLEALAGQGIENVLLLVNHRAEDIAAFVETLDLPLTVTLRDDGNPRGTAGALFAAFDALERRFLVVYGDTLFDIDVRAMVRNHDRTGADLTLLVHPNDHPADSDLVELDGADRVLALRGYPHPPGADLDNLVNAAFYICNRDALAPWRETPAPFDFAKDLFPDMVAAGAHLQGYRSFEYIKDIGTPSRLDRAARHLAEGRVARARRSASQVAVFLDRDGTINELVGHIADPDQIRLIPGAGRAIAALNAAEFRVVIATNQPVLARGDCDEAGLRRIHGRLQTLLGEDGAFVDMIVFCPHHPDAGFPGEVASLKRVCECRKPGVGLITEAARSLNIDLSRSWFVGDTTSDMAAASAAGLRSVLVLTGEAGRDGKCVARPDYTVADLAAAVALIEADRKDRR